MMMRAIVPAIATSSPSASCLRHGGMFSEKARFPSSARSAPAGAVRRLTTSSPPPATLSSVAGGSNSRRTRSSNAFSE